MKVVFLFFCFPSWLNKFCFLKGEWHEHLQNLLHFAKEFLMKYEDLRFATRIRWLRLTIVRIVDKPYRDTISIEPQTNPPINCVTIGVSSLLHFGQIWHKDILMGHWMRVEIIILHRSKVVIYLRIHIDIRLDLIGKRFQLWDARWQSKLVPH